MRVPLLERAEPPPARPACACLRQLGRWVVRALRRYLEKTRSPVYRKSKLSRRFLWRIVFPLSMISNLCDDTQNGHLKVPWDPEATALCWWEFAVCLNVVLRTPLMFIYGERDVDEFFFTVAMASNCTVTRSLWQYPNSANAISTCLPVLIAFGISFPNVLLFVLAIVIHGEPEKAQELTVLPLFTFLSFVFEWVIANLVTELDAQKRATETLLETASDGFCVVDRGSGQVIDARNKILETFEVEALNGEPFISYFHGYDSWGDFQLATKDKPMLLVKCKAGSDKSIEFDAKLIPYTASGDLLSLCVQVLGEKRRDGDMKLSDLDAEAEGYEEDSASIIAEQDQEQQELSDDPDEDEAPGELRTTKNVTRRGSGDGNGESLTLEFELPAGALAPGLAAEASRAADLGSLAATPEDGEAPPPVAMSSSQWGSSDTPFGPMGYVKGTTTARGAAASSVAGGSASGSRLRGFGGSVIGGSEVSGCSAMSYHSICKVGAGTQEETVSAEMISVGKTVHGNDVVKIEFKSKCLRTQLEWQKKLIDQQRLLITAASTEVQESKKKVDTMVTMFDEQRGLLRGFRKIITRSLADLAEVARERTTLFVIEEKEDARRKLEELCEFSNHEHRSFSRLDEGLRAIRMERGQQTAHGLKQLEPLLHAARSEAGTPGSSAGHAATPCLSQVSEKLGEEVLRVMNMEGDASLDAVRDGRAQVVLLGASMLRAWSREDVDLEEDVVVALVSESEEFQEVGQALLAGGEGELRERLRKIRIAEYLMLPASLGALKDVVHEAARRRFADEYLILQQLGRGASGAIYMTKRLRDGEVFALKEINVKRLSTASKSSKKDKDKDKKKKPKSLCSEWELMKSMPSWPTILPAVDGWENPEDKLTYILMPVMSGGTVAERYSTVSTPMEVMSSWYSQTLHALCFLHSRGVVHRDVKPENLLLMADGINLSVCDFGSAMEIPGTPDAADHVVAGGTTRNPPEVEQERRWYVRSDVWAVGSTFWDVMRLGLHPAQALFDERLGDMSATELRAAAGELLAQRPEDERPQWPLGIPEFLADFSHADMVGELLELLHPLVARRPSAPAMVARPHARAALEALLKRRMHSVDFRSHAADLDALLEPAPDGAVAEPVDVGGPSSGAELP